MKDFVLPLELVASTVLVVAFLVAAFVSRRRFLSRSSGTFDCSLRTSTSRLGKGWVLGLARYEADRVEWFRVFDLSLRPRRVLHRPYLHVQDRRQPAGPEAFALAPGAVVVRCSSDGGAVELAMSDQSYTGFAAWLEAAPPGQSVSVT